MTASVLWPCRFLPDMLAAFIIAALAAITTILQIAFFSHFGFPWSTLSVPLLVTAYGVLRDRPLLALGWALVSGTLLDLHGLLGFGAETSALFATFFTTRWLAKRVLTTNGATARFLLGALAAIAHWFFLAAIDGIHILLGGMPTIMDVSTAAALAPLRQAIVCGALLLLMIAAEDAVRQRFHHVFISHAPRTSVFS